jgi:tetratricopeptide (TPR) repeat protein
MVMRDEGEEAGDFFRLVSPWVDEIIVADTRPTGTESHPAAAVGATVIRPSWEGSFSTIRNIALRHARYEWILVLDADEYLSKDGFLYLKSLTTHQDFDGFRFIQRNYRNCPSQSGWVPCTDRVKQAWNSSGWITSYPVKLFKNREEIFFENLIGESVEKAVCRSGGTIGRANILIHHFDQGCNPGKSGTSEQSLLQLVEKQCAITPDDPGVRYDLALRYARLKRLDQAAAAFEKLRREQPESFSVCNELGNVYFEKGEYHKAQHLYQQSSGLEPRFFQAHYNLANLLLVEGDLERSRATYRRALEIFPECGQVYNNLGIICEKRGEDDAAIRNCERAIELNPFLPQAHNNLGTLYAKRGDRRKAEESYLKALGLNLEYTDAYYNLVKLQRENGGEDRAENV